MFTGVQADTAGAPAHRHFKGEGCDHPEIQREQRMEFRLREDTLFIQFIHDRGVKA